MLPGFDIFGRRLPSGVTVLPPFPPRDEYDVLAALARLGLPVRSFAALLDLEIEALEAVLAREAARREQPALEEKARREARVAEARAALDAARQRQREFKTVTLPAKRAEAADKIEAGNRLLAMLAELDPQWGFGEAAEVIEAKLDAIEYDPTQQDVQECEAQLQHAERRAKEPLPVSKYPAWEDTWDADRFLPTALGLVESVLNEKKSEREKRAAAIRADLKLIGVL